MSDETNELEHESNYGSIEPWMADKYIETVKNNLQEIQRHEETRDERKKELDERCKEIEDKLLNENEYMLRMLKEYALDQEDLHATKTQYKYTSLSGTIVIKKPVTKIVTPTRKADVEKVLEKFPDFSKKVETEKLDYANLKKELFLQDDKVFHGEEDVTDVFKLDKVPEKIEIT